MKHDQLQRWLQRVACVIGVISAITAVGAPEARADDIGACPNAVDAPYGMQLKALTGPGGADLTVALVVDERSKCTVPDTLKKIQLKTFEADGTLASTRNVTDVPASGGIAKDIDLGRVPRDRRIDVAVLLQTEAAERTFVVHGTTTTLLRPDLVVREITPQQALAGRPFTLTAVIAERNGDVGASADVLLSTVPGSTRHIDVPRGGSTTVSFALTYGSPTPVELTLSIAGAAPTETDATNNDRTAVIEVTEHQLASPYRVLFPSLLGYGAQFNDHVYAPVTPWPAGTGYGGMEEKVKSLEPQLVRIFYNDNWDANANGKFPDWPTNYASFVKVVQLAQETGATIDISFQNLANVLTSPAGPPMAKFADVLEDLVRNHGLTNVRWAEVGNEPNSGAVTFDQYNALYRALNAELVARGLRDQIQLMGGGLVENGGNPARDHYSWMQLIAANMSDILDGYAEHVYWFYNNPGRLEYRIRDTWHLMNEVLPPEQRKPTYLMEFGIRGNGTCGTKPAFANLYYAADPSCPEIWRTNIAGFQQLWFNVDSAQLGVAGTAKWDAYWGRYDNSSAGNQLYWMIGPPTEGSPVTPSYYAMSLLFHTTAPGWQIVGVDPWDSSDWSVPAYRANLDDRTSDQPEKELVAYAGPSGELTVIGLDTHGKSLNTASTDPPSVYSIGGLPPNMSFTLAEWNATGDGTNSIAETVTTNDAGVARFEVPLQAAFALTTVPVS
jgi:hypothetical protein